MLSERSEPGSDTRAVSNTLGYILLLSIVITGTVTVVVFGATALGDTQSQSEIKRAEHSMTLFDSRAAMVALGTSDSQTLEFGQDSGSFETNPDAGRLTIRHVGYVEGETETIYNATLGSVVYENGPTRLAYQGGGVWRTDRDGVARMVSPPEFHYRAATMTLPVIRVFGSESASGSPSATISSRQQAQLVFPNASADPSAPNGTGAPYDYQGPGRPYQNPLENGTVQVDVTSEYYRGWAEYFRERTTGNVTVYDGNNTVRLTLVSLGGSLGRFTMPNEDAGVDVDGIAGNHPVTDFRLELAQGQNFGGEAHWSLYSRESDHHFEVHVEMSNGNGCRPARLGLYYYNTSSGEHREWQTGYIDPATSSTLDCEDGTLSVDLTSTSDDMTYQEIQGTSGSGTKWCFGPEIRDNQADDPITLDQHPIDSGNPEVNDGGDGQIDKGTDSATLNFTVNHYLSRLGTGYELTVKDGQGNFCPGGGGGPGGGPGGGGGGSNMVDEGDSFGVLRYAEASGARFITYLHVTENEIQVDFD